MSLKEKQLRHSAVYGAMVSAQVLDHMRHNVAVPVDFEVMRKIVEAAYVIADLSEEVQDFEPELEENAVES